MAKDAKGHGSESRGGGMVVTKSRYSQYPGYRTMTHAQRTNARHDAIWERARAQGHMTFNASADAAAASKLAAPGNPKSVAAPVHPDASGPHNHFPITLIGDKGHAEAQKATIKKLLRR